MHYKYNFSCLQDGFVRVHDRTLNKWVQVKRIPPHEFDVATYAQEAVSHIAIQAGKDYLSGKIKGKMSCHLL